MPVSPAAVQGSIEGLRDPNWAFRRAALMVLRTAARDDGNGEAIAALKTALSDPHELIRQAAAEALEECGHTPLEPDGGPRR